MAVVMLVASAAAADPYPQLIVDRPLVYSAGMTAVDLGVDFPSYRFGDSSNTRLGAYVYPDLVIIHAPGAFQLGGEVEEDYGGAVVTGSFRTYAGPGAVSASVSFRIPNSQFGADSELAQSAGYGVKSTVVPHVLSVDAGGSLTQWEIGRQYYPSVDPLWLGAGVGAGLQLVPEFYVHASAQAFVPLLDTDTVHAYLSAGASATYIYDRFDVYSWIRVDELQHAPVPSAGGGVTMRFGG